MADTITSNYGWTKPEVGASNNTWGNKLNTDLDAIDAALFAIDAINGGTKTDIVGADKIGIFDSEASDQAKSLTLSQFAAKLYSILTVPVANGGTGATSASAARTNLGLGTAATKNTTDFVEPTRSISAGAGLAGGGNLSANRTLSIDFSSGFTNNMTMTGSDARLVAWDPTNGSGRIDVSQLVSWAGLVQTSRTISTGAGLTGGGNLSSDRTIAMGTPGTITATTTNDASGNTHTHSINASNVVANGTASMNAGQLGSYAFLWSNNNTVYTNGDTLAGSNLRWANANGGHTDSSPNGTWMCQGYSETGSGTPRTTLWKRVA